MSEPKASFTDEQLDGDGLSKKDLVVYLQENASIQWQAEHKLKGQVKNIAKTKSKDALIADYKAMWEAKAFKADGEDEAAAAAKESAAKALEEVTDKTKDLKVEEPVDEGPPKYRKVVLKKGDKINYCKKGDTALCYYSGALQNGTVFDQNYTGGKRGTRKPQPLRFKVGKGVVIRGWDEAVQTMCIGETAELTIEPEWAYGRRGGGDGKIPPNSTLIFKVELVGVE